MVRKCRITLSKITWVKIQYTTNINILRAWIINDGVRYEGCSNYSGANTISRKTSLRKSSKARTCTGRPITWPSRSPELILFFIFLYGNMVGRGRGSRTKNIRGLLKNDFPIKKIGNEVAWNIETHTWAEILMVAVCCYTNGFSCGITKNFIWNAGIFMESVGYSKRISADSNCFLRKTDQA